MAFLKDQRLFFFLLSLLLALFLPISALSKDPILYPSCHKNFTGNAILQSNINNLVMDMASKASLNHFAVSSVGAGNNTVYGVARCQGDLSHEACSACITDTARTIRDVCPDSAKTHVWKETCFMHYDLDNFIGKVDPKIFGMWESISTAEDPKAFEQGVAGLMAEVIAEAAEGRTKFGSGASIVHGCGNLTIYGMAQCSRDLCESACCQCLESSLETMINACGSHAGCRTFGSSCVLRYETYKFLLPYADDDEAPAPAPFSAIGY